MIIKNGKRLDAGIDTIPVGCIQPFASSIAPNGYLKCDGSLVNKATYPRLWQVCGDTFGASTATQFRIPDLSESNGDTIWIIKAFEINPITAKVSNSLSDENVANALSAAQGKALNDRLIAVESAILQLQGQVGTMNTTVTKLDNNLGDLAVEVVDEW